MAEPWSAVSEWMEKANADWEAVEILHGSGRDSQRDTVVYHCQQCAEKLLKARLIQLGQSIRKTHDLVQLSRQLHDVDPSWSWEAIELENLSNAGVLNRYPGYETSADEVEELIVMADGLRQSLMLYLITDQPNQ